MPVFTRGDDNTGTRAVAIFEQGLRFGLRKHRRFHRLSLAVQLVQPLGNHLGLRGIIERQQSAAERSVANTPPGVDAGSDQETEMIGCHRPAQPRLLEQRGKAGIFHVACGNQALHHIGAVQPFQGNHIADRRKRNDVEQ